VFESRIRWRKIAITSFTIVTVLSNKCTSRKKKIITLSVINFFYPLKPPCFTNLFYPHETPNQPPNRSNYKKETNSLRSSSGTSRSTLPATPGEIAWTCMFVFFSYSTQFLTLLKNFGQVKENSVMSLKLSKVRGHNWHLCIVVALATCALKMYLRNKNLLLIFVCVLSFWRPSE